MSYRVASAVICWFYTYYVNQVLVDLEADALLNLLMHARTCAQKPNRDDDKVIMLYLLIILFMMFVLDVAFFEQRPN
jgi:hypothetical protein